MHQWPWLFNRKVDQQVTKPLWDCITSNVNKTFHEMKVAIGAVLYHSTEFKETENRHLYCPRGTDTWCKYWKDKLNNEKQFVEKPGMPIAVYDIIKPISLD